MTSSLPSDARSGDSEVAYCRFGKRDLDKMSWIAPLVNNRLGDLFNLELRHEQLFFIQGERVLEDIGYNEKGTRFSEAEYGKPIHSLADVHRYGYWLVGRRYDPEVMREALRRQQDGYYYSFFSNQCQDWADRLKRGAEWIERERGLRGPGLRARRQGEREARPTEPAPLWLAFVALALGAGAAFAPVFAGNAFTYVLGGFFVAAAVSHVAYGCHARDWRNLAHEMLSALVNLAGGVLLLANPALARTAGAAIVAATLGIHGLLNVGLSLFSRPRAHWIGKLIAGLLMIAGAALVASRWPVSGERTLGVAVGVAFLAGGISTIVLSRMTRQAEPAAAAGSGVAPAVG